MFESDVTKKTIETYNKTGTYNFNNLDRARSFANKFKKNRPILYSKVSDKPLKV